MFSINIFSAMYLVLVDGVDILFLLLTVVGQMADTRGTVVASPATIWRRRYEDAAACC